MDRQVTPPKRVTSPTWGPPTSMKTGPKTNAKSHCLDYFPVMFIFPVSYFSLIICLEAWSFSKLFQVKKGFEVNRR